MRYRCLKVIRCNEDSSMVGKQGTTWDSGNIEDNATWDNSKLKCKGTLSFQEKNHHKVLFTSPFCMNETSLVAYDLGSYTESESNKLQKLSMLEVAKMACNPNPIA
jgi:hypothetical protein